jgi:DNA-binding NarL/FixJ family response regulator
MKRVLFVDDDNLFRQSLALVFRWNTDLEESVEANSLSQARQVLG